MSWAYREKWEKVKARQGGVCYIIHCTKAMTQLAHCLPQDSLHYRHYGKAVIDHDSNVRGVCGLTHNRMVQINYRGHPLAADQQAALVQSFIDKEN